MQNEECRMKNAEWGAELGFPFTGELAAKLTEGVNHGC